MSLNTKNTISQFIKINEHLKKPADTKPDKKLTSEKTGNIFDSAVNITDNEINPLTVNYNREDNNLLLDFAAVNNFFSELDISKDTADFKDITALKENFVSLEQQLTAINKNALTDSKKLTGKEAIVLKDTPDFKDAPIFKESSMSLEQQLTTINDHALLKKADLNDKSSKLMNKVSESYDSLQNSSEDIATSKAKKQKLQIKEKQAEIDYCSTLIKEIQNKISNIPNNTESIPSIQKMTNGYKKEIAELTATIAGLQTKTAYL